MERHHPCRRHSLPTFPGWGEISLLQALAAKPGRSVSRAELGDKGVVAGSDRAVDVQMARLRRKIEDDPRQPRYILTMRGSGYVLRQGS